MNTINCPHCGKRIRKSEYLKHSRTECIVVAKNRRDHDAHIKGQLPIQETPEETFDRVKRELQ